MAKAPPEDFEAKLLAAWLDGVSVLYTHVPNGGNRSRVTGALLKAMGTKRGVPDYLIFTPNASGRPTALELKRQDGRPSDVTKEQGEWLHALSVLGWGCAVGFGFCDARNKLVELGYGRK